ncbi:hypothetical protein AAMO2058_001671500 [Amorphochlora amoebiformis]|mmetsp:Transcript_14817/g.23425  ORF Transcript_14817/g.23425 Transcript_14817/m.23425 type:complete len:101 (+) Transcript_14817:792-1094(+)
MVYLMHEKKNSSSSVLETQIISILSGNKAREKRESDISARAVCFFPIKKGGGKMIGLSLLKPGVAADREISVLSKRQKEGGEISRDGSDTATTATLRASV